MGGGSQKLLWRMGVHMPQGRGVHRCIPTSSISLIHRSMPSKDQRLVMSYTRRIPYKEDARYHEAEGLAR